MPQIPYIIYPDENTTTPVSAGGASSPATTKSATPAMVKSSFNLPVAELNSLKAEASSRAVSVTQVLREGMADHRLLMAEVAKGGTILIRDADGTMREIVMHR